MPPRTITTAEAPKALSEDEKRVLASLIDRQAATEVSSGPMLRIGDPYVALTNLSVPNRNDPDHGASLVAAGETVYLTEAEARRFERHGARDGRQISVIRKKTDGEIAQLPRIPPRAFSGKLNAPPPPAPGTDSPRPDPAGSSAIQVYEQPAAVPEAADPMPGTEATAGQNAPARPVDAEDIIPDRVRQRARSAQQGG